MVKQKDSKGTVASKIKAAILEKPGLSTADMANIVHGEDGDFHFKQRSVSAVVSQILNYPGKRKIIKRAKINGIYRYFPIDYPLPDTHNGMGIVTGKQIGRAHV